VLIMHRILTIIFIFLALSSCISIRGGGFLESSFELSSASRMPNWLGLSQKQEREDIILVLNYYSNAKAKVTIWKKFGFIRMPIKWKWGQSQHHPAYWEWAHEDWPTRIHPGYVNVTINGITEIVEHKKREPIFYISNEETVRKVINKSKK
jgi:hypothetical protein